MAISDFAHDFHSGLRTMRKHPGFTFIAMLTLAFGLAINALIFSSVIDLLLRPLPAKDPDRLTVIVQKVPQHRNHMPLSYMDFQDLQRSLEAGKPSEGMGSSFSDLMAYTDGVAHLSRGEGGAIRTWVHFASTGYFSTLGVHPMLGRVFTANEGLTPGADPIIVLTHRAWRAHFASDPAIIGQQVRVNGKSLTVVGVMPPGFMGASWGVDLGGFVPASMMGELNPARNAMLSGRGDIGFFVMGRLKPGASLEQAQATASVCYDRLVKAHPDYHAPQATAVVMKERRSRPSPFISSFLPIILSVLMVLALMVLMVAVANVANLLFAQSASRESELALRSALGASRIHLLRQLLAESTLLALGAGLISLFAVMAVSPRISHMFATEGIPPALDAGMDWRLVPFTFGISLAAGIASGLLPAWRATRRAILPQLKDGRGAAAKARHPMRSLLAVFQVATSCMVLIFAGLAASSLRNLSRVKLSFEPRNLLLASFDLNLQQTRMEDGRSFQARLLEKVRALPGVQAASLANGVPFDLRGTNSKAGIRGEGQTLTPEILQELIPCPVVENAYFDTLDIPMVEGRGFSRLDTPSSPPVAVINKAMAQRAWPNENPVGRRLDVQSQIYEVVGMVGEGSYASITNPHQPLVFLSLDQHYRGALTLVLRTEGDPGQWGSSVQQCVRQLAPGLPLEHLRSMEQQMAGSPMALMPMRSGVAIASVQGLIALMLTAMGLFGLMSFAVTLRTREIGIRMAMGAKPLDIIRSITAHSLKLTLIGLTLGSLFALGLARLLAPLLYGVNPANPMVYASVIFLILLITALACWLPIRRATLVNPLEALRSE